MNSGVHTQDQIPEEYHWQIMEAQAKYRHKMLDPADAELLHSINPGWRQFKYDFPEDELDELDLAVWLCKTQRDYKLGELTDDQIAQLDAGVPDWKEHDTNIKFGRSYGP